MKERASLGWGVPISDPPAGPPRRACRSYAPPRRGGPGRRERAHQLGGVAVDAPRLRLRRHLQPPAGRRKRIEASDPFIVTVGPMKAAVHSRYGPPDVVRVIEIDKPAPKDGELLVRVHATTVNRTDCAYRSAKPFFMRLVSGLRRPKATVLGNEFAGEVDGVGDGVTSFNVGDRVFGYNEGAFGAHAEYMTIPESGSLAIMPADSTFEEVAPGTEGSHYALSMIRAAQVQRGQDVLVYGATGAIGSAAVQLLKGVGARVTAVCSTDHVALVERLGADRVVDYTVQNFTADEQTYDVVLDAVGKSSFNRCRRLLKPRGIYLSSELGRLSQNPFLALVTPLLRGKKVMFPVPKHDEELIRHLKVLIESGTFKPVIDRRHRLDEIADAYRYVETGRKIGNVVIRIDQADG